MGKATLSPVLIERLKQEQRTLHDIQVELDRIEECGADCRAYKEETATYQARVAKLLEYYGTP